MADKKTLEEFVEQFIRERGVLSYTPDDLAQAVAAFVVREIVPPAVIRRKATPVGNPWTWWNSCRKKMLKNAKALGVKVEE